MHDYLQLAKSIRFLRVAIAILLALAAVSPAHAQTNVMDVAGAQLAQAIVRKKLQSVAVLDFSGPGKKVTALGQQLADQFSAGMAKAGQKLDVEDRAQIVKVRNENSYAPEIVLDPESFMLLAEDLNVQAVVTGELSDGPNDTIVVDVKSYRVKNGKGIVGLKVTLPMTAEIKPLIAKSASSPIGPNLQMDAPQLPAGSTPARCISCPRADYTREAVSHKIEGVVSLLVVIDTNGNVTDIRVLRALPYGLTAQAIAAVKTWKLTPVIGPDHKPVAVREIIVMSFKLFASSHGP